MSWKYWVCVRSRSWVCLCSNEPAMDWLPFLRDRMYLCSLLILRHDRRYKPSLFLKIQCYRISDAQHAAAETEKNNGGRGRKNGRCNVLHATTETTVHTYMYIYIFICIHVYIDTMCEQSFIHIHFVYVPPPVMK